MSRTREEKIELFRKIKQYKRGEQYSPHKPLLVLFMLGRCGFGFSRLVRYSTIKEQLDHLMAEFKNSEAKHRPESWYPFWYLFNDNIWSLVNTENIPPDVELGKSYPNDPEKRSQIKSYILNDSEGGFSEDIHSDLVSDRTFLSEITEIVLKENFSQEIHLGVLWSIASRVCASI